MMGVIIIGGLLIAGIIWSISRRKKKPSVPKPEPEPIPKPDNSIKDVKIEDYSKDQSAYLKELFSDESVKKFILPEGKDIIADYVVVVKRSDIEIEGNGAKLIQTKPQEGKNSILRFYGGENIYAHNLNFESNNTLKDKGIPNSNPLYAYNHGIDFIDTVNARAENLNIKNVHGDGIYITGKDLKGLKLKNIDIDGNGRQGVGITGGNDMIFDNVNILNTPRGAFDFESNYKNEVMGNIIVRNCYMKSRLLPFPMGGYGILDNILIENNKYDTGGGTTHILGDEKMGAIRRNITFRGNERIGMLSSPNGSSYWIKNAENITIENEKNEFSWNVQKPNIVSVQNSKGVKILNNDFKRGYYVTLSRGTELKDVTVKGNVQQLTIRKRLGKDEAGNVLYDYHPVTP